MTFDLVLYDLVARKELNRVELPVGSLWNRIDFDGTRALVTALEIIEAQRRQTTSIVIDAVDEEDAAFKELRFTGPPAFTG